MRLAAPWELTVDSPATSAFNSPASLLRIAEPEMYQPTIGSECRGAFLLKNTGPSAVNLSGSPNVRYEVSIYRGDRELCRCGGSWGPVLEPGQEIRTPWDTHFDSLSVHPTGPYRPFLIPAAGDYRCRITLRTGIRAAPAIETWETHFTVDR